MSQQDDIETVKRAADAQARPHGHGTGGFAEPLGTQPGDCTCPDMATLNPTCPEHRPAAQLPTAETLADRIGAPIVRHPDGAVEGLKEWATGETTPDDWCPFDSHAASCRCHLGNWPIVRQRYIAERDGETWPGDVIKPATAAAFRGHCPYQDGAPCNCRTSDPCPVFAASTGATTDEANEEVEALLARAALSDPEPVARTILNTAADLVAGDRHAVYGPAIEDFTRTGRMWAAVLGVDEVTPEQVALCMALVKIGRLCQTPNHRDSWVDGCGYLALGGDIAATPGRYDD